MNRNLLSFGLCWPLLLAGCAAAESVPSAAPTQVAVVQPSPTAQPTVVVVPATPTALKPPKAPQYNSVEITMQRTECFGQCPVYIVSLNHEGNVSYDGVRFVGVEGQQSKNIPQEEVRKLISKFYEIDYFSLQDTYNSEITDVPSTITSITIDGLTKKVVNRWGGPAKLHDLENLIDQVARTSYWVKP